MIDTHAHILPGIDDGARDLEESLLFARQAVSQGIDTLFATPHTCDGVFDCSKETILNACAAVTDELEKQGIPLRVLPGAEVRVNHDLVVEYDKGNLLTLGNAGTHLLIELPAMFMTKAICLMIRQLRDMGVTPVIAHAERNPMILTSPEITDALVFSGAAIQITAGSLTGDFGKPAMRAAKALATMGRVFCLGSDIHPGRKYRMADAEKRLIKWIGRKEAGVITCENPGQLLHDSYNTAFLKKASIY